jgi:hypothetical protein
MLPIGTVLYNTCRGFEEAKMTLRDTACEIIDADGGEAEDCEQGVDTGLLRLFGSSAADVPVFSHVEEQVMTLARRDTLASLEAPGAVERAARLLFGLGTRSRALADVRLEALRRAVVVTRHRRHLPDRVARDLREHGFADTQVRAIEARALAA